MQITCPNCQFVGQHKKIVMPKTDEAPVSATEKLVREDIKRLTQNSEEIKKLKEQVEVEKKKTKKNQRKNKVVF